MQCPNLQKSLGWCQGTPELPGMKRRLYYISKGYIVKWPTLPRDAQGRITSAVYEGDFVLAADAKWKYIDVLPDKSQLTSEAQGEVPSQTQLNKLTAVHPAVGAEASAAAACSSSATRHISPMKSTRCSSRVQHNRHKPHVPAAPPGAALFPLTIKLLLRQ